jgi:DNA-binding response OmpR family regulator
VSTILIVDDEKDIIDMVKYNLRKEGYDVLTAQSGKHALDQAEKLPDLILLDIMMPDYDGFEVLKRLKRDRRTSDIPVVLLTAKDSDVDEVVGFELGAADYIVKPISMPKLTVRIRNVLRKQKSDRFASPSPNERLKIGLIEMIPLQHVVRVNGKEIFFPRREFEVLQYLMSHTEEVVTRSSLLDALWGSEVRVVDRTVDVHIGKIRERLSPYSGYIETIKGVGYRMREPE